MQCNARWGRRAYKQQQQLQLQRSTATLVKVLGNCSIHERHGGGRFTVEQIKLSLLLLKQGAEVDLKLLPPNLWD